jgi:hypothetical protein
MSRTQERLDNYYAAEARILARGQSARMDLRQRDEAELQTIRDAIAKLEAQLARETSAASGGAGSLAYRTPSFTGGA